MKKALILQGWFQKPDTNWYPWLKQELEKKNYQVKLPDLPTIHTKNPELTTIINFIENLAFIDEDTTLIGHSLGALISF